MDAELIARLENNIDRGASVMFAAASGYAAYGLLRVVFVAPTLVIVAAVVAAVGYRLSSRGLKLFADRAPRFALADFEVRNIDASETDELLLTERVADELVLTEADRLSANELVLTDADRLRPGELLLTDANRLAASELVLTKADRLSAHELILTDADRLQPSSTTEPLELDDILANLGPDSRVVRLFDPAAMPTPGQLKTRIDRHLRQEAAPVQPSDAAQALADALAELRRSLR